LNKLYRENLLRLKEDYYDHLGEIYLENVVSKADINNYGLHLTPIEIVEFITRSAVLENPKQPERPLYILDPSVGSGRFLLESYKLYIGPSFK